MGLRCAKCRSPLPEGAGFCPRCGCATDGAVPAVSAQELDRQQKLERSEARRLRRRAAGRRGTRKWLTIALVLWIPGWVALNVMHKLSSVAIGLAIMGFFALALVVGIVWLALNTSGIETLERQADRLDPPD